ncbi:hypothetical protein AAC387_Pa02g0830 [Persea americana]
MRSKPSHPVSRTNEYAKKKNPHLPQISPSILLSHESIGAELRSHDLSPLNRSLFVDLSLFIDFDFDQNRDLGEI